MDKLLTTSEARDVLEYEYGIPIAERTLANIRTTGGGPRFLRVRKFVRYRPDDLAAWAQQQKEWVDA